MLASIRTIGLLDLLDLIGDDPTGLAVLMFQKESAINDLRASATIIVLRTPRGPLAASQNPSRPASKATQTRRDHRRAKTDRAIRSC